MDDHCIVISDDSEDEVILTESDIDSISLASDESLKYDDVRRDLPSTSNGRGTGSGCGKGHIKQEVTSLAGKDGALDSESEVQAEEQPSGIGEKNSELDGDYNAEGQSRNQTHHDEPGNISGDVSDASDSKGNGMTLEDLWMESQSYSQVERVEYKFENRPWDLADFSSPDAVQSQESPLPRVSSPGSASSVPSRESPSPLPQVSPSAVHISSGVVRSIDCDRLPHKNPTSMLNEGSEEEPMDTVSDEDIQTFSTKAPVVSESETDSDETCIEGDDLNPSSSQAGSIKSEPPSSDETKVYSNDGDDHGHTDTQPFSPILDAGDEVDVNETTEGFDTQPFSPILDAGDTAVIDETTECFNTQPFSPFLDDETENSLSDASEEFPTSDTIVPRDSPSHLLEDKEHDRREAADLEPKDLFPSDSHISCQSPDEGIHQPQRDDAGSETSSSHRSNGVNQPRSQREDDSPGQYFPTDSQLSISLDNVDTEEHTTQQPQQKPLEDNSQGQYFPTDSQLSINLDNEDTREIVDQHEKGTVSHGEEAQWAMSIPSKLNSSGGVLPCQRNAWCPSELDPQERFLLLQEGESEHVSSFLQEPLVMPSSPSMAPSTSTAAPGSLVPTRNKKHIPRKNKSFRRTSRADKLLSTMKESDQKKEKNPTKMTNSLQDIPDTLSKPLGLSSKEPTETPSASMISSVQDCLQQPASPNSNEMGLEDEIPADPRSLSIGHLSVPSLSFPIRSSYSANISESSATLIGGHAASSGTSETPNTKPDRVKLTGDDRSACPSDPPHPSLAASDMSKPLKKRRLSQTSSIPPGNQGTEPSKVTRITKEFKQEDVLSCILSWNADWFDKHKEEVLQSFLMGKEVPRYHASYPDVRSYQEAFICFLLLEMWSKVSSSVAKDCDRTWRQNSGVNKISGDIVEVQYETADNPTEPHDLSVGDLVFVDMTTDTASEKQFNFGLVRGVGLSDRTICLALHKSTIVPSSTRVKVVTSLSHYLNQIRALLSFSSHPLAKHIIKPEDSSVFVKDTQVNAEGRADDDLLKSYMESISSTSSESKMIRLMIGAAGTGKTAFLCQLVTRIAREHKKVPKTLKNPSYKLLVCAPTNQSLDVLLRKIWKALKDNKEAMKHIVDGVEIVRVNKAEEADCRLTQFLLSSVVASKRKQGSPYVELSEDDLQTKILQQADIVGCTLEDCGLEIVRSSLAGNVFALIVDDAGHCLETEILLALQCKTKHVFLAGDQEQGIVSICSKAQAWGFGHSMLERLAKNFEIEDRRIHRWEVQYRMKEDIAKYPSSVMYHELKTRDKHLPVPFCLRPYIIFDVADGKESLHRDSVINTSEVSFIELLISGFLKLRERFTVGIITPSEGQKGKLLERLQGKNIPGMLVGTPTNFYGSEKDVIILCCTSTSRTPNENGFVMNKQVLNLALTRSKFSLIIVGNMKSLQKMSDNWKSLVDDATGRQLVFRTSQASYSKDAKECHSKTFKDSLNVKASSKGVEEIRPPRHKHVSGDAGIDNRGKRRVPPDPGTEDHERAAKVPRSCSSVQGESSSSEKSFGGRRNLSPSSRDPAQPQSILKKRDGSLTSSSHGEDRGVIVPVQRVHHNLVASTAPGISASSSSGLDASLDTQDGKSLHVIATGMRDNERLPRQQKGQIIAGHTVGKQKPQSSRRMETIEHGRRERRPSGEVTGEGTSRRRNSSKGNETGQNQSRSYQQWQNRSDQQPQCKSRQQQVSSKRQDHDRSERRPSVEATGAETSQRWKGSNGIETRHNQSRDPQQHQNRSDQGPQHQRYQQQVSSERQEHDRRERTPSSEATGAGTPQCRNGSNGIETGQNQSGNYQQWPNRSDRRPQHQWRQQQVSLERQEHDRREKAPSNEATGAVASQHWNRTNGNKTGQNQSRDHRQWQNRSDRQSQHQWHQQQVSLERQEHDRSERRPSGEATGAGTSQRQNGSNGNETGHNQQQQNWSYRRPQQWRRQRPQPYQRTVSLNQLANNPVQLDRNMLHNRTVNEAYGGRSTALTEPRPNIRGRKRSNSVKERQMNNYPY